MNIKGVIIIEDLTGRKFGYLTVIAPSKTKAGRNGWLCECECGNTIIERAWVLEHGARLSCGCKQHELIGAKRRSHGLAGGKYEGARSPLYRCWSNMKSRCYNPKVRSYTDYGARGIRVCDEWINDFQAFAEWAMNHGYHDGLTIERKNSDLDYCPENCEWITLSENSRRAGRRHCRGYNSATGEVVEFIGIRQFAAERDLSYPAIDQVLHGHNKQHKGWIFEYVD